MNETLYVENPNSLQDQKKQIEEQLSGELKDAGVTPLIIAAGIHQPGLVRYLIKEGADIDAQAADGMTPLMMAAMLRDEESVKVLLEANAKVDISSNAGTALLLASSYVPFDEEDAQAQGKKETPSQDMAGAVKALLAAGANPNFQSEDGSYPLLEAVEGNLVNICRALIEGGADVNILDKEGQSLLVYVIEENKREELFQLLLEAKADVNLASGIGKTPLMAAAFCGKLELFKSLLEHGADLNAMTQDGCTAVFCSIEARQQQIYKFLLEEKKLSAEEMLAGLNKACLFGNKEAAECFLNFGANPEEKSGGVTPLEVAATAAKPPLLRLLLKQKPSQSNLDMALFGTLAQEEGKNCVQYLLRAGANPNAKDETGKTALEKSIELGRSEITKAMRNKLKGAEAATKKQNGKSKGKRR